MFTVTLPDINKSDNYTGFNNTDGGKIFVWLVTISFTTCINICSLLDWFRILSISNTKNKHILCMPIHHVNLLYNKHKFVISLFQKRVVHLTLEIHIFLASCSTFYTLYDMLQYVSTTHTMILYSLMDWSLNNSSSYAVNVFS